jgi:hypothetical protein
MKDEPIMRAAIIIAKERRLLEESILLPNSSRP